ncbi:MAG: choice-of-anchor R domain-containing protein, partial [Candidatus Heimdallarchaeaceae archaeon]
MSSVKFDNTEIVTTDYVPRYFKHESAPLRELALLGLAKNDGAILISEKYGTKRIMVAGHIKASTASSMETAIDTFKELFSRKEKNLDISWADGTRRYVATCTRHEFNRDYMNINFCPWIAEFVVPAGIGEDTSLTAALNAVSVSTTPYSSSVTLSGSAEPKPIITITFGAGFAATCLGVSFENTDTDEKIVVNRSAGFANTKVLVIDCNARTVKYDGADTSFHGVFPSFKVGSSNFDIETGGIIDQAFMPNISSIAGSLQIQGADNGVYAIAQSFIVPEKDTTYENIAFYGRKVGSPTNVGIAVFPDVSGHPGGSAVDALANCEASIGTSSAWQILSMANKFTLQANTKYWIVLYSTGTINNTNYLEWGYCSGVNATYKRGNAAYNTNLAIHDDYWTDEPNKDLLFKLHYGGLQDTSPTLTLDIDYYKKYL